MARRLSCSAPLEPVKFRPPCKGGDPYDWQVGIAIINWFELKEKRSWPDSDSA